MPCTEAYKEHIMYTFNGFCKTVIHYAVLNAWRDRSRRRQKEISLEYLTEEKFYPLGTTDEYFEAPYEEYPITICGQTVILTNGELAAALLSLPERNREIMLMYGKEASNRKQEIDRQHHTIPNQKKLKTKRQALWKNLNFWIFPQIQT